MEEDKRKKISQLIESTIKMPKEFNLVTSHFLEGFTHSEIRELQNEYVVTPKHFKSHSVYMMEVSDRLTITFNVSNNEV